MNKEIKLLDIFNWHPFFNWLGWYIPILMVLLSIVPVAMMDLGIEPSKAVRELASINLGLGSGVLLYRFLIMACNDITYNKQKHKPK